MVVRRLVSAETLGGVTVVCADKTGTLTRNEMEVATLDLGRGRVEIGSVRVAGEKPLDDPAALVLVACVLNSDVELHGRGDGLSVSGSATEKALVRAAQAAGLDPRALVREWPRLWLRERDQGAHFVLSLHEAPDGARVAFAKGAPEEVMRLCERDLSGPIDGEKRAQIWQRNLAFAAEGLRVLAVAWRRGGEGDGERREDWERGYTLLGLVGLRDPLRPDAAATVAAASRAGIRTIILTGDQPATARAVAGAVGLDGGVLDGVEVSRLLRSDNHEIRDRLRRVAALSRVAAADKAALVRALREAGEVVAMAGDGVNDAPALKAADVGIAIGTRASDVAREAADIVLASEDLGSILNAVGEGRVVQDNLRRAIRYLLATNLSEVVLALGATALGTRDPFNATRLLWLNLISDTVPALALALEPAEGAVLARPPAPPDAPLVAADARRKVLRDGVGMALAGAAGLLVGGPAVCFSALAGAELGYAFPCRAPGSSPGERFVRLIGGTAGLHLAAIALPSVRSVLRLPPVLSPLELLAFGAGFVLPWAASRSANDLVVVRRGHAVEETR
jgi:Ca2+-transporting ATPase